MLRSSRGNENQHEITGAQLRGNRGIARGMPGCRESPLPLKVPPNHRFMWKPNDSENTSSLLWGLESTNIVYVGLFGIQ